MNLDRISEEIISSWGNVKKIKATIYPFFQPYTLPKSLFIPRGNGRSYGDSAMNTKVVLTKRNNRIISFNETTGIITCQSGILLKEILAIIVSKGWFLPVTPGTKYITLGGAIAADIHGKNHYKAGCISEWITALTLQTPNGKLIVCSKTKNLEFFEMTCGGIGLTGVITEATIQLKKIKSIAIQQQTIDCKSLKAIFDSMENHKNSEYLIAWINSFQKKQHLGKGLVFLGKHSNSSKKELLTPKKTISIPNYFPSFLLNSLSMKLYNFKYYLKHRKSDQEVSLDTFFYPLDALKNWNRIYGKKGLIQYQFVIPKENAFEAISLILHKVGQSKFPSFLSVLKLFGAKNNNPLSFPLEGYSLAMDFKMKDGLSNFLNELDKIVETYKGRIYLVKDSRMSKETFEKGYPKVKEFKKFRTDNNLNNLQSLQSDRLGL